jgi:hypothetical protein
MFLVGGGVLVGTIKHLGSEERDELAILDSKRVSDE